jgi:hypothetical protein
VSADELKASLEHGEVISLLREIEAAAPSDTDIRELRELAQAA